MTERNPEHTRHYDRTLNGVTVNVWARPKSCFFCEHCTDMFVDLDGSPYLWFCELEKDIDDGMYERCENFKDDNFDMRGRGMTREEAILLLHDMKDTYDEIHENYEIGYEQMTALDMAIEALSVANLKEEFESADAVDVYKAHEEEHLNIINRIKELQYAILGEKHQRSHGRLIDADELKKHLDGAWEELNDDGERKGVRLARWYLISAPTVDTTIDAVRCKDCRHRDLFSCPLADNDFQKDEDFCSWGERREPTE